MPSAVYVCNEKSGFHLDHQDAAAEAIERLADCGLTVDRATGPFTEQLRHARDSSTDLVVVDGGDGTIRAVIEATLDSGRPVGIVPGGTMNLLAKDYGVPENRAAAVDAICRGSMAVRDVGRIDNRLFLHTAITGLPVRIGVHRERRRGHFHVWDKVRIAHHAVATVGRDPRLTLNARTGEGAAVALKARSFALVVGRLTDHLFPRPERDAASTGLITALALKPDGLADLARIAIRGVSGGLERDPAVDSAHITHAQLTGPRQRIHAMLDGEKTVVARNATITVETGALKVFTERPEP